MLVLVLVVKEIGLLDCVVYDNLLINLGVDEGEECLF